MTGVKDENKNKSDDEDYKLNLEKYDIDVNSTYTLQSLLDKDKKEEKKKCMCIILNIFDFEKFEHPIKPTVNWTKASRDIKNYKNLFEKKLKLDVTVLENVSYGELTVDPKTGTDHFAILLKKYGFSFGQTKCLVIIILSKGTNDYFLTTDGRIKIDSFVQCLSNNSSPDMNFMLDRDVPKLFIFQLDPINEVQENNHQIIQDKIYSTIDSFVIHHLTITSDTFAPDELLLSKTMLDVFTDDKQHLVQLMPKVTNKLTIGHNKAKEDEKFFISDDYEIKRRKMTKLLGKITRKKEEIKTIHKTIVKIFKTKVKKTEENLHELEKEFEKLKKKLEDANTNSQLAENEDKMAKERLKELEKLEEKLTNAKTKLQKAKVDLQKLDESKTAGDEFEKTTKKLDYKTDKELTNLAEKQLSDAEYFFKIMEEYFTEKENYSNKMEDYAMKAALAFAFLEQGVDQYIENAIEKDPGTYEEALNKVITLAKEEDDANNDYEQCLYKVSIVTKKKEKAEKVLNDTKDVEKKNNQLLEELKANRQSLFKYAETVLKEEQENLQKKKTIKNDRKGETERERMVLQKLISENFPPAVTGTGDEDGNKVIKCSELFKKENLALVNIILKPSRLVITSNNSLKKKLYFDKKSNDDDAAAKPET